MEVQKLLFESVIQASGEHVDHALPNARNEKEMIEARFLRRLYKIRRILITRRRHRHEDIPHLIRSCFCFVADVALFERREQSTLKHIHQVIECRHELASEVALPVPRMIDGGHREV